MNAASLMNDIAKGQIVSLDGAWGTELTKHGLSGGACPEMWNLSHADTVGRIPRSYAESGALIVLTNTFGGSRCKLDKNGVGDKVAEINAAGASISKKAVGTTALVFGSVGPTGEFMEPLGTISAEAMTAIFQEQIAALVAGGADGIVIETMSDLPESLCALAAAKRVSPKMPVVVSMTFEKGAQGFATMMGVTPERAAKELDAAGADIIGSNCGNGIDKMIEIISSLRANTKKPIWAKANAGMPELINGKTVFRELPAYMADRVPQLIKAGAGLIGGCCGTTPEHIAAIAAACRKR